MLEQLNLHLLFYLGRNIFFFSWGMVVGYSNFRVSSSLKLKMKSVVVVTHAGFYFEGTLAQLDQQRNLVVVNAARMYAVAPPMPGGTLPATQSGQLPLPQPAMQFLQYFPSASLDGADIQSISVGGVNGLRDHRLWWQPWLIPDPEAHYEWSLSTRNGSTRARERPAAASPGANSGKRSRQLAQQASAISPVVAQPPEMIRSAQAVPAEMERPMTNFTLFWAIDVNPKDTEALLSSPVMEYIRSVECLTPQTAFHCTLFYVGKKPADESWYYSKEGCSVALRFTFLLQTPRLACTQVQILDAEVASMCRNKCPHVTLALAKGVRPVESNTALESYLAGRVDPLDVGMDIDLVMQGTIRRH